MDNKLLSAIRAALGLHSVDDGSTCRISQSLWDVHDYPKSKGGDGIPSHFHEYECRRCGKKFLI